jgi:hypothetical protein
MSSTSVQNLAFVSVGIAAFEQQLLTNDGTLDPDCSKTIYRATKALQEFSRSFQTAGDSDATVALRSAHYCASVTAAAMRTVSALHTVSGCNFLFTRTSLTYLDRMVPGYAFLESHHEPLDHYKQKVQKTSEKRTDCPPPILFFA